MKAYIINELGSKQDGILSNAIDDYLVRNVQENEIVLHLFQHPGINMGSDDFHHSKLKKGIQYFETQGYPVYLRQSGGRAIVSDHGVLNMSMSFKSLASAEENYLFYSKFIQDALDEISNEIKIMQIDGAYCPGDYDLSIDGKKFCGIAQKRIGDRVELDSYFSVHGSQEQRVDLIRGFYEVMGVNPFPIEDGFMANLEDFTTTTLQVTDLADLLINEMKKRYGEVALIKKEDLEPKKLKKSIDWTLKRHQQLL